MAEYGARCAADRFGIITIAGGRLPVEPAGAGEAAGGDRPVPRFATADTYICPVLIDPAMSLPGRALPLRGLPLYKGATPA
jgi:hypothetical protein